MERKKIMGRKRVDISGTKFGMLTVIGVSYSKRFRVYWNCKCDCGNAALACVNDLIRGTTRSCGCIRSKRMTRINNSLRQPIEQSGSSKIIKGYRLSALKKGLEFSLNNNSALMLFQSSCHYCGIEPSNANRNLYTGQIFRYNGIDRVNNNLGYIVDNCVPCCRVCNWAKGSKTYEEFVLYLDRLVAYRTTKAWSEGR